MVMLYLIIARQPTSDNDLSFKVPAVPFVPLLSIFINLYLMFQLDVNTWIRFAVWLVIGYIIYFTYGIRQSIEGNHEKPRLSGHEQNNQNGDYYEQSVSESTRQSTDDLHDVNIEHFTNGSTVQLSHQ